MRIRPTDWLDMSKDDLLWIVELTSRQLVGAESHLRSLRTERWRASAEGDVRHLRERLTTATRFLDLRGWTPGESIAERDARLVQEFKQSGKSAHKYAGDKAAEKGVNISRHQIRRVISEWQCATNAQPRRRKPKHNEPSRNPARVPHDTAQRAKSPR